MWSHLESGFSLAPQVVVTHDLHHSHLTLRQRVLFFCSPMPVSHWPENEDPEWVSYLLRWLLFTEGSSLKKGTVVTSLQLKLTATGRRVHALLTGCGQSSNSISCHHQNHLTLLSWASTIQEHLMLFKYAWQIHYFMPFLKQLFYPVQLPKSHSTFDIAQTVLHLRVLSFISESISLMSPIGVSLYFSCPFILCAF